MITAHTTLAARYRLEDLIGRGGMADVYRGQDLVLERAVAVKVVRGTNDEDASRFATEIRAMAALNHPNIVHLFDAGTEDGAPYLVMELVEGPTLPSLLADGPLESARTSSLGGGLAAALAHAHSYGIVHRDVKPGNVLVDTDGRPRLSDFGIARLADATRLTGTGMTTGTAGYVAPEQLTDADVGPPADIYSLGLVLLEALVGRREFTGTPVEAAMARLHRDPNVPDDLPPGWADLLQAMTARDPAQRPTAAGVTSRLRAIGDPAQSSAAHDPEEPGDTVPIGGTAKERTREGRAATPARSRRARLVTTVAVTTLLAAALVLAALAAPGGDAPDDAPPARDATEEETTLPAELDDALERLEEAVSP